jgi:hypothetical protein
VCNEFPAVSVAPAHFAVRRTDLAKVLALTTRYLSSSLVVSIVDRALHFGNFPNTKFPLSD